MGKIIKNGTTYGVSYGDLTDIGYYSSHTWYVDSDNGDDNNNGLTISTPFRTLNKAMKMVAPMGQWATVNSFNSDRIHINCEATNPYDNLIVSGKNVRVYAWNFSNDTDAESTGTIKITSTGNQGCVQCLFGRLWLYTKGLTLVNSSSYGIFIGQQGICWINNNGTNVPMNISINSNSFGIFACDCASLYIYGTQGGNSSISITSTASTGLYITSNANLTTRCSVTVRGATTGAQLEYGATWAAQDTGATSSNPVNINIATTGTATGGGLVVNSGACLYGNAANIRWTIATVSTCTNAVVFVMGGRALIRGIYLSFTQNAAARPCIQTVMGDVFFNGPTSGTYSFTCPAASTNNVLNSSWGGRIVLGGGTSNSLPTINGKSGLCAETGGVIAWANIKNNATGTANTARNGGRIYSGNQSSIPNY